MLLRFMFMMGSARRLQQINRVFKTQLSVERGANAMRPFANMINGGSAAGNFLRSIFIDIDSSLLTSEARCTIFIEHYKNLPKEEQGPFLCDLAKAYGVDNDSVFTMASNILASREQGHACVLLTCYERMRSALKPKYKILFIHIGRVQGGVKFLVDVRGDVLSFKQSCINELDAALYQELNNALKDLLMMWFTVGFLELQRITWNSPCDLVQKVSNYEAVHKIKTWEDIKRRVGPYRRCYIFTHNSMPREPVVVLHTALTNEISSSIHSIIQDARFRQSPLSPQGGENYPDFFSLESPSPAIAPPTPATPPSPGSMPNITSTSPNPLDEDREDPSQITCAVFYSITSTQKGLQGVEMGNYLIKTVVRRLQEEFPHLQQFSSLSPIPGFRDWLISTLNHTINMRNAGEDPGVPVLLPDELASLMPYKRPMHNTPLDTFKDFVTTHEWYRDEGLKHVMMRPLLRLCAHYLYVQKRRNYALNPVANFHLSNGAVLWRINFLADTSHRGLTQSCSMMVNYRYFLESTDYNSRHYLENHVIQASDSVLGLLRGPTVNGS